MPLHRPAPLAVRAARFCLRALFSVLRVLLFSAVVFFPVPIFFKPKIPSPDRRNLPAEVRREE